MKKLIAGVDEVGRGSLIGPVFAAAVILNIKISKKKIKDSKKLSKAKREILEKYHKPSVMNPIRKEDRNSEYKSENNLGITK